MPRLAGRIAHLSGGCPGAASHQRGALVALLAWCMSRGGLARRRSRRCHRRSRRSSRNAAPRVSAASSNASSSRATRDVHDVHGCASSSVWRGDWVALRRRADRARAGAGDWTSLHGGVARADAQAAFRVTAGGIFQPSNAVRARSLALMPSTPFRGFLHAHGRILITCESCYATNDGLPRSCPPDASDGTRF
jgi:hypothetical protein